MEEEFNDEISFVVEQIDRFVLKLMFILLMYLLTGVKKNNCIYFQHNSEIGSCGSKTFRSEFKSAGR